MNNNDNTNDDKRFLTEEELSSLSEEQLLDLYVEQMMIDKGITELEGEARDEMRKDLKERLLMEINRSMLMALPDEIFERLNQKMEDGSLTAGDVEAAVKEAGLNVDEITEATMAEFRKIYLESGEQNKAEE